MRFDLNDDVEFFRATASRFLDDEMPVAATRLLEPDPDGFDRATWRRAAELGWTSLLAPESLGGGSLSANAVADLAVVAEEMGRRVASGPLLPVNVVVDALRAAGSPRSSTRSCRVSWPARRSRRGPSPSRATCGASTGSARPSCSRTATISSCRGTSASSKRPRAPT